MEISDLDNALEYLINNPDSWKGLPGFSEGHLFLPGVPEKYRTKTDKASKLIIEQLFSDGYLRRMSDGVTATGERYRYDVNFKGILHHQKGGYVGELERISQEKERNQKVQEDLQELRKVQKRTSTQMVLATGILAFGALVASIYYLLEICKFFSS